MQPITTSSITMDPLLKSTASATGAAAAADSRSGVAVSDSHQARLTLAPIRLPAHHDIAAILGLEPILSSSSARLFPFIFPPPHASTAAVSPVPPFNPANLPRLYLAGSMHFAAAATNVPFPLPLPTPAPTATAPPTHIVQRLPPMDPRFPRRANPVAWLQTIEKVEHQAHEADAAVKLTGEICASLRSPRQAPNTMSGLDAYADPQSPTLRARHGTGGQVPQHQSTFVYKSQTHYNEGVAFAKEMREREAAWERQLDVAEKERGEWQERARTGNEELEELRKEAARMQRELGLDSDLDSGF